MLTLEGNPGYIRRTPDGGGASRSPPQERARARPARPGYRRTPRLETEWTDGTSSRIRSAGGRSPDRIPTWIRPSGDRRRPPPPPDHRSRALVRLRDPAPAAGRGDLRFASLTLDADLLPDG